MIPFIDLTRQHAAIKSELMRAVEGVVDSCRFVLGEEGQVLEREIALLSGVGHGIGVGSGTDALRLTFAALDLGPGDEVITPAFSFVASSSTITMTGATPVFADIDPATFAVDPGLVERAITPRTRAIVVVHLYGHPAPIDKLAAIADAHRISLVEDAAQAIGATWQGRTIGGWGDAACLSFYPTKNLGACGDGGMVLTRREDLADRVRRLRHHGDAGRYQHVELGWCSRLDEIQAAMLRVKLRYLDRWTEARRRIAARYRAALASTPLTLPIEQPGARHIYHQFSVRHRDRDALAKVLHDLGVGTAVHYPAAVPGQPLYGGTGDRQWPEAFRAAREVLSLPCFPEMTDTEIDGVIAAVREACDRV